MLDPLANLEREENDRFVLYLRTENGYPERALASFPGYPEARQAHGEFACARCDCVIRFVGPTGGGD